MSRKLETITVKVPHDIKEKLKKEATETGYSVSELIRAAIDNRKIVVLEAGRDIATGFVELCDVIQRCEIEEFKEEGGKLCQLLKSVISRLEEEV